MGNGTLAMVRSLRDKLARSIHPNFRVVTMPDFYLDYILSYPGNLEDLTASLETVARRGGGNIVGWKHLVGRGGNSPNLAAQLTALEVEVVPIIETNELGYNIIAQSLKGVDLSHVKRTGTMSSTLSLEADYSGRRVNMMMSNPASHAKFGPEKLSHDDKSVIRDSDFVVVLNWGQNQRGTDLAEVVFKTAREGDAITFFDPGDPSSNQNGIQELNNRVLVTGLVDVLSVNENELLQIGEALQREGGGSIESGLFETAGAISMLGCRVDLHTPEFSASFEDGRSEKVPCLAIKPAKVTGAGDVWNAASIFAEGMSLNNSERLLFANAAAAAYLTREDLNPPGLAEILEFSGKLERSMEKSAH